MKLLVALWHDMWTKSSPLDADCPVRHNWIKIVTTESFFKPIAEY